MSKLIRIWLFGIAFAWFMTFAAWRFAHPLEIIVDWLLVAIVITSVFMLKLEHNARKKAIVKPEQYCQCTAFTFAHR